MIQAKRVYEPGNPADGQRFLVERLWPRGMKKEALLMDGWLKAVAPSVELRRWFNHDLKKWAEFRKRYRAELDHAGDQWQSLLEAAASGNVTLLYSAHDKEHNSAIVLCDYLNHQLGKKAASHSKAVARTRIHRASATEAGTRIRRNGQKAGR